MTERNDMNDAYHETEALVRAAGMYVRVSDDLRPRVLESAREIRREQKVHRGIGLAAMVVVALAITGWPSRSFDQLNDSAGGTDSRQAGPLTASITSSQELLAVAGSNAEQATVDVSWALVDAFKHLRQQQSDALRNAARHRTPNVSPDIPIF